MSKSRARLRKKRRRAIRGGQPDWRPLTFLFVPIDADEECPFCALMGVSIHHADEGDGDDV